MDSNSATFGGDQHTQGGKAMARSSDTAIRQESVAGLLLDEANPRFAENATSQADAINKLIDDNAAKLMRLGEDIVSEGAVNPSELPMVLEHGGELIVIEGNRRLAALKLLRSPGLSRNDAVRAKFEELARSGTGPDSLWIVPVQAREAAKHWIDLRHTGENDGAGVVQWAAWQANSFRRRRGTQADRATMFCDAVARDHQGDAELQELVARVRQSKLTTLGRLISDPDVRRDIGFDFEDDSVQFLYASDDMRDAILRVFRDLAGETVVTDIFTKKDRAAYIKERSSDLPSRAQRLPTPREPGSNKSSIGNSTLQSKSTASTPSRGATNKPDRIIYKGLKLRSFGPRVTDLLRQSQHVDIDTSPAVCAVMLRVILELVVVESIARLNLKPNDNNLKGKVRACMLHLDPECNSPAKRDKALEPAWIRSQEPDGFAVQGMHSFVHNPANHPMPSEVRALSHTFLPVLQRLADAVGALPS